MWWRKTFPAHRYIRRETPSRTLLGRTNQFHGGETVSLVGVVHYRWYFHAHHFLDVVVIVISSQRPTASLSAAEHNSNDRSIDLGPR